MSSGCGDVLSLADLQTAKKHQLFEAEVITGKAGGVVGGASIDYATNQVTGQTQKTLPAVLRDAGFRPASFTFETGGTLAVGDSDVAVLWPVSSGGDGQYYIWKGAYPKVVPAASSPDATGGVSDAGWWPWGDITLREELQGIDGFGVIGKATVPEIRSYAGALKYIACSGKAEGDNTGSWFYYRDDSDTTTADNGGTVLVDSMGRRWKWDFQQNHTGMFWEEYGALIHRVGDRLLIGDAVKNGANTVSQPDWLTQYQLSTGRTFGFTMAAQMCVQSGVGSNEGTASNAFVAAGQTKHLGDNYNSIGVLGFSVANKPTGAGNAYAGYFEGFRSADALGGAYGVEIDTATYAACVPIDPYQQSAGQVIGLQIAAGAELSPIGQFPSNAAINVRNNGATYQRGIIVAANALTGCDGVVGSAIAMQMAKGHGLVWYSGAGANTSSIYGLATDPVKSNGIVFGDGSLAFVQNVDGKKIFDAEHSVSGAGVNYPSVRGSGAGFPVQILARGSDTNIDIHLVPKGDAFVRFGQWTGQGDQAINGFIAIKDAAGNIRKIPTIA